MPDTIPALPEAFIARMAERLGNELPAFVEKMNEPYCRGARLNPLKKTAQPLPDLQDSVPWQEQGYYIPFDSTLGASVLHEAGACYLQEPSAMLPAAVLNARPGERVLDLCAAPGGKATQSGLKMAGEGLLVCNEPVPKRAQILSRNIERMGITNALVVSAMPEKLAERWPGLFDAVQVDAPCSGEGMFRRHPEARLEWTPESPAGCAGRQAAILDSAAELVRPGGRIVYSTCTLNRTENEDTVEAFLQRHPDFALHPFSLPGADAPDGMLTCYPHRMRGEGHFTALMVRDGDERPAVQPDRSLPKPDKNALAVLRAFSPGAPMPTAMLGQTLVAIPELPDVKGLKVLRAGLHLGEVRGKLFVPDHAWAVAAEMPDFVRAELTEEQALQWIHGETVPCEDTLTGWVLPVLQGLALGWGKASGGMIKNHYPKGLRR